MKTRFGPGWWHPESNPARDLREWMAEAEEEATRNTPAAAGGRVPIGIVITIQVESDTRPGVWYTLQLDGAGRWTCDCPARVEDCKHVKRARNGEF